MKETFGGTRNVFCLDLDSGYMGIHTHNHEAIYLRLGDFMYLIIYAMH